ncbi:MAG: flagellar motor protein MotB [Planctomycetota bacterium]
MSLTKSTGILLGLSPLLLCSCYSRMDYARQKNIARGYSEIVKELQRDHDELERQNDVVMQENALFRKIVQDQKWVEEQKAKLKTLLKEFEAQAGTTGIPGVEVIKSEVGGEVGFRIEGKVLFASGRAEITSEGKSTLSKLLPILLKGKTIRIEGHTDSDPISKSKWPSNLHLSAARALEVGRFLMSKGLDEEQILIGGFGMSRPASLSDKAVNRRVEIFLQ